MSSARKTPFIRYQYDALDRLTGYVQIGQAERQRFYCDSRLASEIKGSEQSSLVQHGDQLLAQQLRHSTGIMSALLATDVQRSVLNALQPNAGRGITYTPYGHHPAGSGLISLLGFNGQRPDPLTGHYPLGNGYRAYNPVLMRFNCPDHLSPFGAGGINAYSYCLGDPINGSDPTGRAGIFDLLKAGWSRLFTAQPSKGWHRGMTKIFDNVVASRSTYKGKSRITVFGHGSEFHNLMSAGKDGNINPHKLYEGMKKYGFKIKKGDNVQLLVCHSADPNVNVYSRRIVSFGEEFAEITGGRVKAYSGRVKFVEFGPEIERTSELLKIGEVSKSDVFLHTSKAAGYHQPVVFDGMEIRRKARLEV